MNSTLMKRKAQLQAEDPRRPIELVPSLIVRSAVGRSHLVPGSVEGAAQTYARFAIGPSHLMPIPVERVAGVGGRFDPVAAGVIFEE